MMTEPKGYVEEVEDVLYLGEQVQLLKNDPNGVSWKFSSDTDPVIAYKEVEFTIRDGIPNVTCWTRTDEGELRTDSLSFAELTAFAVATEQSFPGMAISEQVSSYVRERIERERKRLAAFVGKIAGPRTAAKKAL